MKTDLGLANIARRWCWAPLIALAVVLPCQAQYKVIGADGKVTYTDRAPQPQDGKVSTLGLKPITAVGDPSGLPIELRQAVTRYPVTLYVLNGNCDPCEAARRLLRQRGIPYSEKQVQSADDGDALERLSGGRDAPTLSIGSQTLRGFAPEVWGSYLDAAGYPRESHLPPNYQYAAATPLTERRDAAPRQAPARTASQPGGADAGTPEPPALSNPLGIKF